MKKQLALASLILGIFAILFAILCWFVLGIVFAPLGLVAGVIALVLGIKSKEEPMGLVGLILGALRGVVCLVGLIVLLVYMI